MGPFIDTTVKNIDARLSELAHDVARLEAARAALLTGDGTPRRRPGRPRKATASATTAKPSTKSRRAGRKPGRPRGRRSGGRAGQALALVKQRPGITIPQLAEAMKISPNYLYRVLPKLADGGQVRREGKSWHPAA